MAERHQGMMAKLNEHTPNSTQVLGFLTLFISGAILLVLTGLTVAGTVVGLVVLTPVLIFFSPILIPVGTVLFVAAAGLFSVGGFGLAVFSLVSWLYNYVKGRHPPGSDQIDYARMRIADTASHMKDYAREYGGYLQGKVQDAAPGA
uniref:Oleosin n=1 Tax=Araucaria cunninghamii TaxID=56994 RepID=A0A0D6R461_ARACU